MAEPQQHWAYLPVGPVAGATAQELGPALPAGVQLEPVESAGDVVPGRHALLLALGADPREIPLWGPAVAAGVPVVLPKVPGPGAAAQEALALGAAVLAEHPTDPDVVIPLAEKLAASVEVDATATQAVDDLRCAAELIRLRLAGQAPDTRPRVLLVAATARELASVHGWARLVASAGGDAHVVVVGTAGDTRAWPGRTSLTVVDDPTVTSPVARGERLLVLRVPALVNRLARRLGGGAARRLPAARPVAAAGVAATDRVTRVLDSVVHRRVWTSAAVRLRPWLLSRRVVAQPLDWTPDTLDLVVAQSADAQALVWELLRRNPQLESRGSLNQAALVEVVRRRSRRAVAGASSTHP